MKIVKPWNIRPFNDSEIGGFTDWVRTPIGKPDYTCIAHTHETIGGKWYWCVFECDENGFSNTKEDAYRIIDSLLVDMGWHLLTERVNCLR